MSASALQKELSKAVGDDETSGKRPSCSSASCGSSGAKRARRTSHRVGGIPDGRCCDTCKELDTSIDPVTLAVYKIEEARCWGYSARADGTQQGYVCFYCLLLFQSRYKHMYRTRAELVVVLGSNQDEHDRFRSYLSALISYFIQHGGRGIQLRWADIDKKQVSLLTVDKVEIAERPDELWDYDEYVALHGDPNLNGKGHRETRDYGKHEVVVPSAQRRQVLRSRAQIIEQRRVMDNGEGHFIENQQDTLVGELQNMISIPVATGEVLSLSAVLDTPAATPAAPSGPSTGKGEASTETAPAERGLSFGLFPKPAATPAKKASEGSVPLVMTPVGLPSAPQAAQAQPTAKKRAKATATGSGPAAIPASTTQGVAGGASTPHSGEKRKKGRPQRDMLAVAAKSVTEFEEASETTPQFFGPQYKSNRRFLARLATDINAKADGTKDMQEWQTLTKSLKQIKSIIAIGDAAAKSDISSSTFGSLYDAQMCFLDMDPQVTLKFPAFIALKRHSSKLEECSSGTAFWSLLTEKSLTNAGYEVGSPEAEKAVFNAIRSRIVWATSSKPAKEMEAALTTFFDSTVLADAEVMSCKMIQTHRQEVEEVSVIELRRQSGTLGQARISIGVRGAEFQP